jgi:hypothetical protein
VFGALAVAIGAGMAIAQLAGDDDNADAPPRSVAGNSFTDPQGTYTMSIGPEWTDLPSTMVAEVETWAVGDPDAGFTPNVNVLTQDAPGMDREEYMELSVASLESIDAELVEHAFVTGPNGGSLGLMEYIAQPPGVSGDLHFIAVFDLRDGTAIVATYTASLERFDELRAAVEPYLLTLEATG